VYDVDQQQKTAQKTEKHPQKTPAAEMKMLL
jgi:hypothetical protein